jgi:hypothetical protein
MSEPLRRSKGKSYHLGTSLVGKQDVAPRTVSPAVSAGCCQVSAEFQSSKPKRRRPTLAKTKIARVGHPPTEQGPRTSNGLTPEGVSYRSTTAAGIDPSATGSKNVWSSHSCTENKGLRGAAGPLLCCTAFMRFRGPQALKDI